MHTTTLLTVALLTLAGAPAATPARPGTGAPLGSPPGPVAAPPTTEALIAQLRSALLDHGDAEQDALLRSLRQLRDPGLRPLFAQIAAADRAVLRIHGVLGLAELDTPSRVDLLLVKRMPDSREQLVVIGEALRAGMLPTEQLEDIVRWPGLDPALVVLIMGRLQRAGVAIDPVALDPFIQRDRSGGEHADGEHDEAAIYAALERRELLVDTVGGTGPADAVLERILALPRGTPGADSAVAAILEYIRDERLARSADFALRVLGESDGDATGAPSLRFQALRTLLVVAPTEPRTIAAFGSAFASADQARRRALGLIALEAVIEQPLLPPGIAGPPAPALPPELFQTLRSAADPMLDRIAAAGQAAMIGFTPEAAIAAADLVAEPHPRTAMWALRFAERCAEPEAATVHLALLRGVIRRAGPAQPDLVAAGVAAAAALAERCPGALIQPLADALAASDILAQRLILAGTLRATNPAAAAIGGPPVPLRPLDDGPLITAMAALLRLRHAGSMTESDFQTLCGIALGSTLEPDSPVLPEALRVQAAWLALRHGGQQRIALMRILAESPRPDPPR